MSAVEITPRIFTVVPNAIDSTGQQFNELNMHPKTIQILRGVVNSGYKIKMSGDKGWEVELEIEGMPDLSQEGSPTFDQGPNIALPAPSSMFIEMTNAGVGYTTLPTTISCTGLTGATFGSQIIGGRLNIFLTNPVTALAAVLGTMLPLTITGGTSTTPATGQVYIG
jgi:hypothetical protein